MDDKNKASKVIALDPNRPITDDDVIIAYEDDLAYVEAELASLEERKDSSEEAMAKYQKKLALVAHMKETLDRMKAGYIKPVSEQKRRFANSVQANALQTNTSRKEPIIS